MPLQEPAALSGVRGEMEGGWAGLFPSWILTGRWADREGNISVQQHQFLSKERPSPERTRAGSPFSEL